MDIQREEGRSFDKKENMASKQCLPIVQKAKTEWQKKSSFFQMIFM
jgi:hypothetical protein